MKTLPAAALAALVLSTACSSLPHSIRAAKAEMAQTRTRPAPKPCRPFGMTQHTWKTGKESRRKLGRTLRHNPFAILPVLPAFLALTAWQTATQILSIPIDTATWPFTPLCSGSPGPQGEAAREAPEQRKTAPKVRLRTP